MLGQKEEVLRNVIDRVIYCAGYLVVVTQKKKKIIWFTNIFPPLNRGFVHSNKNVRRASQKRRVLTKKINPTFDYHKNVRF